MKKHRYSLKIAVFLLAAIMVFSLTGCATKGDQTREVAKVGDVSITQGQLDNFTMLSLYRQGYDLSGTTTALKKSCLQDMIDAEAISQYCEDNGITVYDDTYNSQKSNFIDSIKKNDSDFLEQNNITDEDLVTYFRSQYLSNKLLEQVQSEYTDEEITLKAQEYYESHKDDYEVDHEKRLSEILTHKKTTAEKVISMLDSGEPFADVAREMSEDTNSAANGGDLGYFTKDEVKDQFGSGVFEMSIGQYSQPIKTSDGYAVVMITDDNDSGYKSFEEVSQEICYTLYSNYCDDRIEEIEKNMTIETYEVR